MEVMAHQLILAVDGVVDADHVFANVGRLRDGCDVLGAVVVVRLGKGARIHLQNRILVDQVGRDMLFGKRLSGCQSVGGVEGKFAGSVVTGTIGRCPARGTV